MKMTFDHEPLPLYIHVHFAERFNYKNKLKTNQKHIEFLMINYHVQVSGASVMQFELPPLGLLIPTQTFL